MVIHTLSATRETNRVAFCLQVIAYGFLMTVIWTVRVATAVLKLMGMTIVVCLSVGILIAGQSHPRGQKW